MICGKTSYQYHSQAMTALNGISRANSIHLRVYFCDHCQAYHHTSNKKKMKPATKPKYPFTIKNWNKKA